MPTLPYFRFHPDPIATGSIIPSDEPCDCCGHARGFVYEGPTYRTVAVNPRICPWCIADGSAHEKLNATFQDEDRIGGNEWDKVPQSTIEEIAYRTPGFCGWQAEYWWSHCGEAACYLGSVTPEGLVAAGPEAVEAIRESIGLTVGDEWNNFFGALDNEGSWLAYLFRCSKCGALGGYQDCD